MEKAYNKASEAELPPDVAPIQPEELKTSSEEAPKEPETIEDAEQELDARMSEVEALVGPIEEFENLPREEMQFVVEAIEKSPEGKSAIERLQKATADALTASHHLSADLSEKLDPRFVKAIGLAGKLFAGIGAGLAGGPIASVAGSKVGEYLALKTLHKIEHRLPDRLRVHIEKPEDLEKIEMNQQLIGGELEELKDVEGEMENVAAEIEQLSEDEKKQFLENLANDAEVHSNMERMKSAYENLGKFYEKVEHQHPILGPVTEMALHTLLGPALGLTGLGEGAIHVIEVVGGPVVEKVNLHVLQAFQSIKEGISSAKERVRSFLDRKKEKEITNTN